MDKQLSTIKVQYLVVISKVWKIYCNLKKQIWLLIFFYLSFINSKREYFNIELEILSNIGVI